MIRALLLSALAGALPAADAPNVAVVKRFYDEVWSQGKLDATHKLVAPSYQFHSQGMRLIGPAGPELVNGLVETRRGAFPDLSFTVQDIFSEGDRVAVRWVARGTHQKPLGEEKPTGKKISYEGLSIFQVAGGQIYAEWTLDDFRSVLRELGIDRLEIRRQR
jgi:ketosteroid isomerase-like protein